jgi:hypothetical protein
LAVPAFRNQGERIFRTEKMKKFICLTALAATLVSQPILAGTREDVLAAMQRCSVIPDDRTWLDCTYGAQQLMRGKLGLTPAPEFQQRLVPPAAAMGTPAPVIVGSAPPRVAPPPPRNRGGVMDLFSSKSRAVVSTLVAVRYDSQGGFIATLENGQVWHQVNVQTGDRKVRLTLGSKITVVPGSMWSYDLKIGNASHAYKVDPET